MDLLNCRPIGIKIRNSEGENNLFQPSTFLSVIPQAFLSVTVPAFNWGT